jgi:hypothetical protein
MHYLFRLEERVAEISDRRAQRREALERVTNEGWDFLPEDNSIHFVLPRPRSNFIELILPDGVTPAVLFFQFLPLDLLQRVLDNIDPASWYRGRNLNSGRINVDLKKVLYILAAYIFLMGRQEELDYTVNGKTKLDKAMKNAQNYFETINPGFTFPCKNIWEKSFGNYHITHRYYDDVSANFQSIVREIGCCVAGDEKLLYFTGESIYIRKVVDKPDRIGFWYYELVGLLAGHFPFLLDMKLHDTNLQEGVDNPVHLIVNRWVDVLEGSENRARDPDTLLIFDNYYFSMASQQALRQRQAKYIAACKSNTFNDLSRVVEGRLTQIGDHCGLYNAEHNELFLHVWDATASVGKKYCFSNAFTPVDGIAPVHFRRLVPAYDWYKKGFMLCDTFNQHMNHQKFPYKCGGRNHPGEGGHEHKWLILSVVKNVWNILKSVRPGQGFDEWQQFTQCLATELVEYSYAFM